MEKAGEAPGIQFQTICQDYLARMDSEDRCLLERELLKLAALIEVMTQGKQGLDYLDPRVYPGIDVLREHFGRYFGLGRGADMEAVLTYIAEKRPFADFKPSDPRLRAFVHLGTHDFSLWLKARREGRVQDNADYSGLFNWDAVGGKPG